MSKIKRTLTSFEEIAGDMLTDARSKHAPIQTLHEGYAVLLEEVDELWAEVKLKRPNVAHLVEELAQISAMCQRIYSDVLPGIRDKQEKE